VKAKKKDAAKKKGPSDLKAKEKDDPKKHDRR
jgi:hypothetical protein